MVPAVKPAHGTLGWKYLSNQENCVLRDASKSSDPSPDPSLRTYQIENHRKSVVTDNFQSSADSSIFRTLIINVY